MNRFLRSLLSLDILKLLQNPVFLPFILSVIFSQIAINMMNVIFIFLIYHITSSSFLVSLLILTFTLPQIFLSFIGGVVADIRNKKTILLYGNLLRASCFVVLFFNSELAIIIYIISFIVSIITQFYVPAETPMIPKIVPKQYLTAANSLFGVGLFGSVLIGYVFSGPLISVFNYSGVFLFLTVLFIISSFCIYLLPNEIFVSSEKAYSNLRKLKGNIGLELKETYFMLSKNSRVIAPCLLLSFSQIIVLVLATIAPSYAKTILEVPAENLSILLFGPAALGMLVASIIIGSFLTRLDKQKMITTGVFISSIVLFLFPLTSKIVSRHIIVVINTFLSNDFDLTAIHLASILSFFAGFANALIFIPSQTIIQEKIPEEFRSKVYGLLFGLIGLLSLLPILLTGGFADKFGVSIVFFMVGTTLGLFGVFRLKMIQRLIVSRFS